MGEYLAKKIKHIAPNLDADVVIPIPESSRTSAMQLAYKLNLKYREGFIKNRYIGRTFIMPGQTIRKKIRSLQTLGDRFRIQRKKTFFW
jgi:amidophosphoribosyltransferase